VEVRSAVGAAVNSSDPETIEKERTNLANQFAAIHKLAVGEETHGDREFVSRVDLVGLYQSVLSKVFSRIPSLQGYGNGNPIWVVTLIEEGIYAFGNFFKHVFEDVQGHKEPLIESILKEWKDLRFERAPYPQGIPGVIKLPANATIALLADWGGIIQRRVISQV
jgi:hypothetical protein